MFAGLQNRNRDEFNQGLGDLVDYLKNCHDIFLGMWDNSKPASYMNFRTFIMGIEGNAEIFPNGVVYEGCFDNKPQFFRGESGAQDSIIPATDCALDLDYPKNSLTKYLFELRDYRPHHLQNYIDSLKEKSTRMNLKEFVLDDSYSSFLLLKAMKNTFNFRHLHWAMVKKYIHSNTNYPKATGGTPITTWLPNQMGACLEYCQVIMTHIKAEDLDAANRDEFQDLRDEIDKQI